MSPRVLKGSLMDLELDIECCQCGLLFRQNFGDMPHGKTLQCPFCFSPALLLKEQAIVEKESELDMLELSFEERVVKRKIKL